MGSITDKPILLFTATPVIGHLIPISRIAKELIERGYHVTFITGSAHRKLIEDIGASFVPLEGYSDFTEEDFDTRWPEMKSIAPGPEQLNFYMENMVINAATSQFEVNQKTLKFLREKYSGRKIIQCTEGMFYGALLPKAGVPGLQSDGVISLNVLPVFLPSIDTAPFGAGLLPDSSPEGRERNIAMNKGFREQVVPIPQAHLLDLIESLGGKLEGRNFFFEIPFTLPDRVLQMCIPSVEYPRSDAPNTIKFTGGLPKGKNGAFENPPPFWDEVVNNKTKKIIAVCQGTIAMDYNNLVIPTLKALKDRDDILVVVALGRKGMTLPKETEVPANARISDYIPYDDLLPHCSIFITNGGYGSFQHSVANGTPLIVGGDTEDKPEVAARAEWAGNGYNLRSGRPTVEAIEKAVNEVLTNSKYKNRALELQAEMATYDPTGEVIETIEELAAQTGN